MPQLAIPTFVGGPRDDLATADVYVQKSATQVINSIQKLVNNGALDVNTALRGGPMLSRELSGLLPVINLNANGLAVNKDNLITRLSAGTTSVSATLRSALLSGKSGLVTRIGSNIPGGGQAIAQVGTVTQRVNAAKLTSLGEIGKVIHDLACSGGGFVLHDPHLQIGIYTGLIKEALRNGLKNVFGGLMSCVDSHKVMIDVSLNTLPSIIKGSDVGSLDAMAEALPAGHPKLIYPSVVQEFGSSYTHAMGSPLDEKQADYAQVAQTFSKLDPNWNQCSRNGTNVVSVATTQAASDDFHEMVKMSAAQADNTPAQLQVLGTVFAPTDVDTELQRHFPATVTGPEERQTARVVSPDTLSTASAPAARPLTAAALDGTLVAGATVGADGVPVAIDLPDAIEPRDVAKYDPQAACDNNVFNPTTYIRGVAYRPIEGDPAGTLYRKGASRPGSRLGPVW